MLPTPAYAALTADSPLVAFKIERREPGPHDVLIDITHCGICHTDISTARGHYPGGIFPMVPGHEIVGKVSHVGSAVTRHALGDVVGVGCMVDTCGRCSECESGMEQYCNGLVATYSAYERDGRTPTYGGYSRRITVHEKFVAKIPPQLSPAGAAPLLCAGVTTYSPLRHWKIGKGSKVAVIGLGGLGHVAVKLARAMGAEVTVLSTSQNKRADALRLGAHDFGMTQDEGTFKRFAGRFNLILNTVSAQIPYDQYLSLLERDGTLVLVGGPDAVVTAYAYGLLMKRRSISASIIGSMRETQEMLDFCAEHRIESDIEMIRMDQVNSAYERVLANDVRYRFVIDMATLA